MIPMISWKKSAKSHYSPGDHPKVKETLRKKIGHEILARLLLRDFLNHILIN